MPKSNFKTNLSPQKLKCSQCVYKTKNRSDLRRHERRHNDVKFPCDICNMPFMTFGHLGGHKRTVHGISAMSEKNRPEFRRFCSQCDYTTWYSSDMAKHRRKHVTNQFPCPVCNYPLGNTTTLKVHMRKYHSNHHVVKKDYNDKRHPAQTDTTVIQNDYSKKVTRRRKNRKEGSNKCKKYSRRSNTDLTKRNEFYVTTKNHSKGSAYREKYPEMHGKSLSCFKERHTNTETTDRHPADELERSKRDVYRRDRKNVSSSEKNYPVNPTRTLENNTPINQRKVVDKQIFCKHTQYHSSASASQLLSCKHCEFRTIDKEAFRRHYERHEKGKFRCQYCSMPFLFSTNLDRHLKRKHTNSDKSSDSSFDTASINSPNLLKCISCRFMTYSYNQLDSHVKLHDTKDGEESQPNTEHVNQEGDTDSNSEYNFDDDCPDVGFSFEDTDTLDTFSDGKVDTDDKSLSVEGPISKPNAERVHEEDELVSNSELKLDYTNPDLQFSLEDGNAPTDTGSSIPVEGQQSDTGVEEYYCSHCNYKTLNKKFIKLHMTMHGFPFGTAKNSSNRRASKKTDLRGYKTRIVKQNLAFKGADTVGNDKNITFETNTLTETVTELNDKKDIAEQTVESKAKSHNEDCNIALEFESAKKNDLFRGQSSSETNDNDTDLVDASESLSSSTVSSTSSTKSSSRKAVGRMTKQEFIDSRKFYKIELRNGAYEYECRICMTDNIFTSNVDLFRHFKKVHEDIRRQICATCKYCNGPFPKTD